VVFHIPGGHLLFSGQLDGNVKYHSMAELSELFDPYFLVVTSRYVHCGLYYYIEGWMLVLMNSVRRISMELSGSRQGILIEPEANPRELDLGSKSRTPPHAAILSPLLGQASDLIKRALTPTAFPALLDRIGTWAMGPKGAEHVILLAQRKEDGED